MKKIKKKFITNIIFNVIALVSTILASVFCIYIYKLDMLPGKYLTIAFIALGVIYTILIGLTLPRKMKVWIKGICCFFFIINMVVFAYGIKYSDKTIDAINQITSELVQKEDYELKVLSSSKIATKEDLKGKKIGIFKNDRYDDVVKELKKDVECELIDYDDPVKFFEDLSKGNIDAVIASDAVYSLLEDDLDYMKLELKTVHIVGIPLDENFKEIVKVEDVTNTIFNIYVAGGDKTGSIDKVMNTDVNMVVSVDPVNHKILLTSIPRDYYVVLPSKGENAYDKLTHAGYYGVQESIRAIEKLLDIEINYYAKVNFTTIEKVVDAIGGVDVNVRRSFTTSNKRYHFNKGITHMDGAMALRYARERKVFADGDVERVKNQQDVIDAIIKKMTSSTELLSSYGDVLKAISANFKTSLSSDEIARLVKMQLNDMRGWTSESQNLTGFSDMSTVCYSLKGWNLYVMKQDPASIKKAKEKIDEFFGVTKKETKTEETDEIKSE